MKTTIFHMILGGALACTLAACSSTGMNSDSATGASGSGTTASSLKTTGTPDDNTNRGQTPINCTTTGSDGATTASTTPGTKCPAGTP